jgi:hypothetical protein
MHLAGSVVSRRGRMVYPFSQNPDFASVVEEDQDLAGERALAFGFDWDLGTIGLKGARLMVDRTRARVAKPLLGMSQKDQFETQAIFDVLLRGALKGFKLRLLGAWVESSLSSGSIFAQDYHDLRAIVSYSLTTTPARLLHK